jgi:hypothetical protein
MKEADMVDIQTFRLCVHFLHLFQTEYINLATADAFMNSVFIVEMDLAHVMIRDKFTLILKLKIYRA